ncbi:MAG: LegC family aminotransferase [Gammaproteobacteria bacterium]|nr:MAG: LegC family aminotransferase [Gammaproteobacteria bacterium]
MIKAFINYAQDLYQTREFIPLHAPSFQGNERFYVVDTIDSTFVSSVGKYVDQFESSIEEFTSANKAVATVNGTAALHAALFMAGVGARDLVITQALTFVATCNAISHLGAEPLFVDISKKSLGLCPESTEAFLIENAFINDDGYCIHRQTNRHIRALVPMHTFGHPVELDEITELCSRWNIILIEDSAESLGSYYKGQHTGTFGRFGVLSFNGNKVITTGGGGMILCQDNADGIHAKHITTTAKKPHAYEFFHDELGFNYRMPNINAALGCAQMESLQLFLDKKRELADCYSQFFAGSEFKFVEEPGYAKSNYWLNAVICESSRARDNFLKETNENGVMTRPVWQLMNRLPMFSGCIKNDLPVSEYIEGTLVNIPSSPIINEPVIK